MKEYYSIIYLFYCWFLRSQIKEIDKEVQCLISSYIFHENNDCRAIVWFTGALMYCYVFFMHSQYVLTTGLYFILKLSSTNVLVVTLKWKWAGSWILIRCTKNELNEHFITQKCVRSKVLFLTLYSHEKIKAFYILLVLECLALIFTSWTNPHSKEHCDMKNELFS